MRNRVLVTVIVTYNRLNDLEAAVGSILNSTRLPSAILIVDNASEYDVRECIDAGLKNHELTHFIRLPQNFGGAGGFKRGVEYAIAELGAEVLHLMDDDGVVHSQQIEILEEALGKYDLVNSCVISAVDEERLAFGVKHYFKVIDMPDIVIGSVNPFNGTMFLSSVYTQVGGIMEDFFIWGDEVDFVARVLRKGLSVATIKSAVHYHPESKSSFSRILGMKRFLVEVKPRAMFGIFIRNRVYIAKTYKPRAFYYKFILRYLVFFLSKGDFGMLKYLFTKWSPSK